MSKQIKDLVAFTLTGFPLNQQKESLLALLQGMAFSHGDIVRVSFLLAGKSAEEIQSLLTVEATAKNQTLKQAHEYLK